MTDENERPDDGRWIRVTDESVFVIKDGDRYRVVSEIFSVDPRGDGARILESVIDNACKRNSQCEAARLEIKGFLAGQAVNPHGPGGGGGDD